MAAKKLLEMNASIGEEDVLHPNFNPVEFLHNLSR